MRVWGCILHGVGRRRLDASDYTAVDLSRPFDLRFEPDVVLHAAALASPWGTRAAYRRQNIEATRHVIDFCRRRGLPRLVYVSSSSVFYHDGHQLKSRIARCGCPVSRRASASACSRGPRRST